MKFEDFEMILSTTSVCDRISPIYVKKSIMAEWKREREEYKDNISKLKELIKAAYEYLAEDSDYAKAEFILSKAMKEFKIEIELAKEGLYEEDL